MTDKEKMEMLNLRKRVEAQREEIKRLQARIEYQARKHEYDLDMLRSRCYPGAEKFFDSHEWGLLKIVTVNQ